MKNNLPRHLSKTLVIIAMAGVIFKNHQELQLAHFMNPVRNRK